MQGRKAAGLSALVVGVVVVAVGAIVVVRNEAQASQRADTAATATAAAHSSISSASPGVTVPQLSTTASAPAVTTTPSPTSSKATPTVAAKATPAKVTPSKVTPTKVTPTKATPTTTSKATPPAVTTSSSTAITSLPPTAAEPKNTASDTAIDSAVQDAISQASEEGLREHVVVADRASGKIISSSDDDATVPSMSIAKLFVATDVLVRNGGISKLDAETQQSLWTMITRSDDGIMQDFYDNDGGDAIIERTVERYGLQDSTPTTEEEYWGDIQISARDMASFLQQALASPLTGKWLESAMAASADTGDDGFDQNFGMNAISGAGSKQGWGCCLGGVLAIHSVGFTANQIVVVLSTSDPDTGYQELGTADELENDPGAQTAMTAADRIAKAAVLTNGS